jgi:hypothetical protein
LGEVEDDTTMGKKQLFEYETPSKTSNELLRFQIHRHFLEEKFTKTVHSISGTMQGNDSELTFPAFERRTTKHVDKLFKGLSG